MRLPAHLYRAALVAGLTAPGVYARAQDEAETGSRDAPEAAEAGESTEAEAPEAPAQPPDDHKGEAPATTPPSPADRLTAAVSAYQASRIEEAQVLLAALVNDETYEDEQLRQQARVYLGEVLYRKDNQEAARRVFERVLTQDPDFRIDPFRHPPDVCGFFDTIRTYIQPPATAKSAEGRPLPPLPSVGYVGFGIYQLQNGKAGRGAAMLTTQTVSGIVSAITFAHLLDSRIFPSGGEEQAEALRTAQWTSTSIFWGTWAWGILDAGRHWRSQGGLQVREDGSDGPPSVVPPGIRLQVSGRFR